MSILYGARLSHVYWLGGGSGAGKSTIARALAAAHGLTLYDTDAAMADHGARCSLADTPFLARFKAMTMDERWLERSPQDMLETFHWFRGEAFDLILEDLLALPADRPVIAEGFRLLPALVAPHLQNRHRALWLLPTPAFRRAAFAARGDLCTIAGKTSNPPKALENLLERDALFTQTLTADTAALNLQSLEADCGMGETALLHHVETMFHLA